MSWDELKAALDEMARVRGYRPVDEVVARAASTPLIPKEPQKPRPEVGAKPIRVINDRIWWNREQ